MVGKVSIIILIICMFSGVGYCDNYYTSKTNPKAQIPYVALSSGAAISDCLQYSRQNPDYIYYIPAAWFFQQGHFYYRGEMVDDKMDEFANRAYSNQIAQVVQQKKEEKKSAVTSSIYLSIFLVFATIACIGIWSGYTDRAIFYHSTADAVLSSASIVGVPISMFIIGNWTGKNNTFIVLSCIIASASLIYNGYMAFRYNSKFYGFCVLIGRALMSVLGFLVLFSRSGNRKDDPYGHHAVADTIVWMALVASFAVFVSRLVNKDRIDDRKFAEAVRITSR